MRFEFEASEQLLNPTGVVQGGFLAAMLDETMGPAALSALGPVTCPDARPERQLHPPAAPGRLVADGRVVHLGKTVAFLEASLDRRGRQPDRDGDATARIARGEGMSSPSDHVRVTEEPLSVERLAAMVGAPRPARS